MFRSQCPPLTGGGASDAEAGAQRFASLRALSVDGSVSNAASVVSLAENHTFSNLLNSCQPRLRSLRARSATRVAQRLSDAHRFIHTDSLFTPPPPFLFAALQAHLDPLGWTRGVAGPTAREAYAVAVAAVAVVAGVVERGRWWEGSVI